MSFIRSTKGSTAGEYMIVATSIALLGTGAFTTFGDAAEDSIRGDADGRTPSAPSARGVVAAPVAAQAARGDAHDLDLDAMHATVTRWNRGGAGTARTGRSDTVRSETASRGAVASDYAASGGASSLSEGQLTRVRQTYREALQLLLESNHPTASAAQSGLVPISTATLDAWNRTLDRAGSSKKVADERFVAAHVNAWRGHFSGMTDLEIAIMRSRLRDQIAKADADAPRTGDAEKNLEFMEFVEAGLAGEQRVREYEDSLITQAAAFRSAEDPGFQAVLEGLSVSRGVRPEKNESLRDLDAAAIASEREQIRRRFAELDAQSGGFNDAIREEHDRLAARELTLIAEQLARGYRVIRPGASVSEATRRRIQYGDGVLPRSEWPPYSSPRNTGLQNGRIPASELEPLGIPENDSAPGAIAEHMLWRPAAVRFRAMKAAMEEAGVWSGINESYRTYDKQVYFKNCQISRACNNGNTAATPGTSNHGWGMAVDLVIGPGTYQWLSAHATEYGFDNAEGARAGENWHWTYTGADQR